MLCDTDIAISRSVSVMSLVLLFSVIQTLPTAGLCRCSLVLLFSDTDIAISRSVSVLSFVLLYSVMQTLPSAGLCRCCPVCCCFL